MDTTWLTELKNLNELVENVSEQLKDFMTSNRVLLCIDHKPSDLYVCLRKSYRLIDELGYSSLDMCQFSINSYYRHMGAATKIIKELHKQNSNRMTYLTHVQDGSLQRILTKFGWQRDKETSFYNFTIN